jgi:5'(3')-deoxyribonucleotidase
MKSKTIAVDVDDVIAELHREWIRRYNRDFHDTLSLESMPYWKISTAIKPEAIPHIFNYLRDKDLYDYVVPVAGAKEGIRTLREMGFRVVYATACVEGGADSKINWLVEHGFLFEKDTWLQAHGMFQDFISVADKSLVQADYLIDDRETTVREFTAGKGILFDRPYNKNTTYDCVLKDWFGIREFMEALEANG